MKNKAPTSTIEFLDLIKSLKNLDTDYQAFPVIGVKRQTVYSYRAGRSFFDDEVCPKVAELTGYPVEYVLAIAHAERAKSDELRTAWKHVAAAFGTAAMLVLTVGILAPFPY